MDGALFPASVCRPSGNSPGPSRLETVLVFALHVDKDWRVEINYWPWARNRRLSFLLGPQKEVMSKPPGYVLRTSYIEVQHRSKPSIVPLSPARFGRLIDAIPEDV